jgi:predicted transposase YdaD
VCKILEDMRKETAAKAKAEGKVEGKAEGMAEGELNKAREISLGLLKKGLSYEEIAEVANVSIELIKQWENCPA